MSGRRGRLLAAALAVAGAQFAAEQLLGHLVWSASGERAYKRQDGDTAVLTICRGQSAVVRYEVPGVSWADLI